MQQQLNSYIKYDHPIIFLKCESRYNDSYDGSHKKEIISKIVDEQLTLKLVFKNPQIARHSVIN